MNAKEKANELVEKYLNGNDDNRLLAVRAYKCTHCGKVVNRESNKKWIKSYCDETGQYIRLMLVKA